VGASPAFEREIGALEVVADDQGRRVLPLPDELEQVHFLLVAADEVDAFDRGERLMSRLRIAAEDSHVGAGIRADERADEPARLGVGFAGHRAGVDHAQVRGLAERHDLVTFPAEQIHQDAALGLVQPTAERMDGGPPPVFARRGRI